MANYVRYQEFYKSFLGGWSFADGDETLTIKDIKVETVRNPKTMEEAPKVKMWFEEKALPMVVNVTNAEMIADIVGSDKFSDWIGKKIVVGSSPVQVGRNTVDAIRVRSTKPDDKTYICEECGSILKSAAGKQPSELAEISKRNTGRVLCLACMKKAKEESNG